MVINKLNREDLFTVVKEKIIQVDIVGDIGCGIRPQNFIEPRHHICIDPHNQYLEYLKELHSNNNKYLFVNADWSEAIKLFPQYSFETIFLLDVIEHLEKDVALKLLEETKKLVTKQIVIFTPLGFIEQHHETEKDAWGLDGGKWQEHKSGWLPEDFGEGWEFFVCEDFHTHDNAGNEYEKPKGAFFAIYNSQNNVNDTVPIFSVIVPTYNQAQFLNEALDSLINQTFPFWEAVVVNDGSTDNTKEVMEEYALSDRRIRIFNKENGGVASALNEGIKNAKGEWICWLSSDDFFEPDKLQIHFNEILKFPEIKFFHSHWYLLIDETKKKIAPPLWLAIPPIEFQVTRFFWANYIHGNAIAVHRSVFDEVGMFDESLRQGQDFDMWLRISARFVSYFIDKRTCVTRIHKGQTTNSFVEGGVLDSTRALIKFLNEKNFRELFPFTDFRDPNNIVKAINEIIFISTKTDAFLYRCGFTTALVEKTMDWLNTEIPNHIVDRLFPVIKNIAAGYLEQPLPVEIKEVLKLFLNRKKIIYNKHNFVSDTKQYVNQLILKGDQKQAKAIETYLVKILPYMNKELSDNESFQPVLLGYPKESSFEKVDPKNIKHWILEPGSTVTNSIRQHLKIGCKHCDNIFNIFFEYEMRKEPTSQEFICPNCKTGFTLDDENFDQDFLKFHNNKVAATENQNMDSSKVAFFVRDASVVGGGTKILFKYIEWLIKLGVNVTIYSFAKKPDWVDIKLKYIQIQSEREIKTSYKYIFVFSIFDVPFVLNRISISKVVHICQGYEGYHFGRDYEEMRCDKHILTKLHALPVKNISVSTHLVELFKDKFNRESYYIPNGIDHRVFSFNKYEKREKSILFVGNPFHSLKGFDFLGTAIKEIQKSSYKIENLKLIVVMGYKPENLEEINLYVSDQLECAVEIKYKLSSKEIADIMKRVSLVACTSWYEGFSLPLLEAMATGTIVITTYNMGAQSFCKEGFNSFNVEYGNVNDLSKIILNIFNSSININHIILNAYKTSLQFSNHNSVRHFINAFEKLFNKEFENQLKNALLDEYKYDNLALEESLESSTDAKPKVSIVIPVFNQLDYTKKCIESLVSTIDLTVELIIVDNASTDKTYEYLSTYKNNKLKFVVIRNTENLGFPKAVNRGLIESSGNYVVIANNDIIFTDGWLTRMIEVAESIKSIGLVGPISNEVSGLQKDNDADYETIEEMYVYAEKVKEKNKNQILQFPRIAFLCTLIKKEVIEKIGGLDERFSPGNYEDDDYCLRAQLAGFKTVIAKDVFIHHYGSKSFKANGEKAYSERLAINQKIFVEKWGATPDEIWLQNKQIKPRQILYPIDRNIFLQHFRRVRVHLADNEINLAQSEIEKAIENFSTGDAITIAKDDLFDLAGNLFFATNDIEKSRYYFEQELQLSPTSSNACLGLGKVFYVENKLEAAKTMFEWAIKNNSDNKSAINALREVNQKLDLDVNHNSLLEMNFAKS
jgi:GT2 family glycosyltransferase/glycosyltransferase involved in cell wall biosynthesis